MNYRPLRLYTFVANHYLSPLQCGVQTAHVVSELSQFKINTNQRHVFDEWALYGKTIIICGAGNHAGVVKCYDELQRLASELYLPCAIFREDEQSMNGMATVCGVIVPENYWASTWVTNEYAPDGGHWEYRRPSEKEGIDVVVRYDLSSSQGQFINHIKQYRLA